MDLPGPQDIVFGWGGLANNHVGNKAFRSVIEVHKKRYKDACSVDKKLLIHQVQSELMEKGFRFVEWQQDQWVETSVKKARSKVAQTLRERAPADRNKLKVLALTMPQKFPSAVTVQDEEEIAVVDSLLGSDPAPVIQEEDADTLTRRVVEEREDWVPELGLEQVSNSTNAVVVRLKEDSNHQEDLTPVRVDCQSTGGTHQASDEVEFDQDYVHAILDLFCILER